MLSDHRATAAQVGREVDEMVAAATEKRRRFVDRVLDGMRTEDERPAARMAPEEEASLLLLAAWRAPPRT